MAKQYRRHNRKRMKGRFFFLYKLLTFFLICGAISIALSLFFKIETIRVSGSFRYTEEEILSASGIRIGDNLFLLNKSGIAKTILDTLPYVETVQISRQIPSTLQIFITESRSFAAIRQDGMVWLLNGDGKIVDRLATEAWLDYPQINGISLAAPAVGQRAKAEAEETNTMERLRSLLYHLTQKDMLDDVQVIRLEDTAVITLRYLERFDVIFSFDADFDYKLDYLCAVVKRLEVNETGTIDMTQNDKVSFIPD